MLITHKNIPSNHICYLLLKHFLVGVGPEALNNNDNMGGGSKILHL